MINPCGSGRKGTAASGHVVDCIIFQKGIIVILNINPISSIGRITAEILDSVAKTACTDNEVLIFKIITTF